jgi:hypothetical protein
MIGFVLYITVPLLGYCLIIALAGIIAGIIGSRPHKYRGRSQ